eukprot:SM000076S21796  [mRNA]  locus=s76:184399:187929:- [translate_table: standard]
MFRPKFRGAQCKTLMKLAVSRINLLRNKRELRLQQMRQEIAKLLRSGREPSARIRVEHIIREQNIVAAYDVLELFCERIVVRLPIIESQRECPVDLVEAVSSLLYAAPQSGDIPELLQAQLLFQAKYGKEFVASAVELRPGCGVNRRIIEKLSIKAPAGQEKQKLLQEIASEHGIEWESGPAEEEHLQPEDLLVVSHLIGQHELPLTVNPDELPIGQQQASAPATFQSQMVHCMCVSSTTMCDNSEMHKGGQQQFIPFVFPSTQAVPLDAQLSYSAVPPLPAGMMYSPLLGEPPAGSPGQEGAGVPLRISKDTYSWRPGGKTPPLPKLRRSRIHNTTPSDPLATEIDIEGLAQAAAERAETAVEAARAATYLATSYSSDSFIPPRRHSREQVPGYDTHPVAEYRLPDLRNCPPSTTTIARVQEEALDAFTHSTHHYDDNIHFSDSASGSTGTTHAQHNRGSLLGRRSQQHPSTGGTRRTGQDGSRISDTNPAHAGLDLSFDLRQSLGAHTTNHPSKPRLRGDRLQFEDSPPQPQQSSSSPLPSNGHSSSKTTSNMSSFGSDLAEATQSFQAQEHQPSQQLTMWEAAPSSTYQAPSAQQLPVTSITNIKDNNFTMELSPLNDLKFDDLTKRLEALKKHHRVSI